MTGDAGGDAPDHFVAGGMRLAKPPWEDRTAIPVERAAGYRTYNVNDFHLVVHREGGANRFEMFVGRQTLRRDTVVVPIEQVAPNHGTAPTPSNAPEPPVVGRTIGRQVVIEEASLEFGPAFALTLLQVLSDILGLQVASVPPAATADTTEAAPKREPS
jgi:hypothetical protein